MKRKTVLQFGVALLFIGVAAIPGGSRISLLWNQRIMLKILERFRLKKNLMNLPVLVVDDDKTC